jgi:hypothetical protein
VGLGPRSFGVVNSSLPSFHGVETPSAEEKRAALEETLQSSVFRRAEQLRKFLTFVCEMELAGRSEELCEYLIGVEALGRPLNYSPAEDAAVRRRAADLREKLQEVYAGELARARIRIDLPKGTYVPRFVAGEPSLVQVSQTVRAIARGADQRKPSYFALAAAFMLGALAIGVPLLGIRSIRSSVLRSSLSPHPGVIYEAESTANTRGSLLKAVSCPACSGGWKVGYIGSNPTNTLAINDVTVAANGVYEVQIDYVLKGTRSFFLSVNDGPGMEVPLSGDSWSKPATTRLSLSLRAGRNRIVFYNNDTYAPDLDRLVLH